MEKPAHGLSTAVDFIKCHDGDTVTVRFTREFDVRLKDINAPELRDEGGKESRDALTELLKQGELTLFVPAGKSLSLMDISSFTRIVGSLWVGDVNVQDEHVKNGKAEYVRGGRLEKMYFSADEDVEYEEKMVKMLVPKNSPKFSYHDLYISPQAMQDIRKWGQETDGIQ